VKMNTQEKEVNQEKRIMSLLGEIKGLLEGKQKEDRWLNIKEACEYSNVSTATIRRNIKSNKLKASNTLGKLLFKESELESWLCGKENSLIGR